MGTRRALLGAHWLALWLVVGGLTACPAFDEPPSRLQGPHGQRLRIADGTGEPITSLRVRRNGAVIYDAEGIRLGRASAQNDSVVVRDRSGAIRLVFALQLPAEEGTGEGESQAHIRDGSGESLGVLHVDEPDRVVLFDATGTQQRGAVLLQEGSGESATYGVVGADGTDTMYEVRVEGRRELALYAPDGTLLARLTGMDLPAWIVAAMALTPPPGLSEATYERWFQVGMLVYLRKFGEGR
jgi:hypothetical protein